MSMRLNLKISLTCPRHRGYNPAKDGRSGIKGSCSFCERILDLYDKVVSLETVFNGFREAFKAEKVTSA